ncbi:MAG: hypothetical protein OJF50_006005 [Nitrospira sp.]|nr:hypothetical protein [Nitrospira sp.]
MENLHPRLDCHSFMRAGHSALAVKKLVPGSFSPFGRAIFFRVSP